MKTSKWFHAIRLDQCLKLTEISELTGVAPSQISRIENEQSDLTLLTGVKIAYALGVNLVDIVRGMGLSKSVLDLLVYNNAPTSLSNTTIQDIEKFLVWYSLSPTEAKQLLYEAFGQIKFKAGFEGTKNSPKSWDYIKSAIEPSGTDYIRLQYPTGISNSLIRECLQSRGVLGFYDLGIFIRQSRQELKLGLIELAEKTHISYSALRRIEVGDIERIKLDDIFSIDDALGNSGEVLAIAWKVAQFYSGVLRNQGELTKLNLWNDRELALADTLVAISRWYQVHAPTDNWLKTLHDRVQ